MGTEGKKDKIKSDNNHPRLLTVPEVAFFLHVHVNTVRRWCDSGVLKSYRINSRGDRRFKLEEIQQFLDRQNHHGQWDIGSDMEKVLSTVQVYD